MRLQQLLVSGKGFIHFPLVVRTQGCGFEECLVHIPVLATDRGIQDPIRNIEGIHHGNEVRSELLLQLREETSLDFHELLRGHDPRPSGPEEEAGEREDSTETLENSL